MHAIDFSLKWRLPSPDAQLLASHCRIFSQRFIGFDHTCCTATERAARRCPAQCFSIDPVLLRCNQAATQHYGVPVCGTQSLLHKVWRLGNYEQRTLTSDLMTLSTVRLTAASAAPAPARDPPCFPHANISNCKMRGAQREKLHPCPTTWLTISRRLHTY